MTGSAEVRIVLSTAPPERAGSLARSLVQERLAAGVNVLAVMQWV